MVSTPWFSIRESDSFSDIQSLLPSMITLPESVSDAPSSTYSRFPSAYEVDLISQLPLLLVRVLSPDTLMTESISMLEVRFTTAVPSEAIEDSRSETDDTSTASDSSETVMTTADTHISNMVAKTTGLMFIIQDFLISY